MIKIAVLGATGRMGGELISLINASPILELCGAGCKDKRRFGQSVDGTSIAFSDSSQALAHADVAIDFSMPEAVEQHLKQCIESKVAYVGGVTGLSEQALEMIAIAGQSLPVLWAPNMSVGVNLCFASVENIARQLGDNFVVKVVDLHHAGKKDAPSGTALEFGRLVNSVAEGIEIEYESVREGDNPGHHRIIFTKGGEIIELAHQAGSRKEFAQGAVEAASWIAKQPAGRYNMKNLLEKT